MKKYLLGYGLSTVPIQGTESKNPPELAERLFRSSEGSRSVPKVGEMISLKFSVFVQAITVFQFSCLTMRKSIVM